MKLFGVFAVLWLWIVEASENCPDACTCSQKKNIEGTEVNCYRQQLQHFPLKFPLDAWIIKMGEQNLI